jgi:cation diffusion facilitator CzcD-associated flavoprotein CzcO
MTATVPEYEVIVVGSGFGGLCMGVKLKQAGIDNFLILEKDAQFGGTWWANHYPGCAVDVPSHLYSFSFARKANWTRAFARQAELLEYTGSIIRDFGLAPHLRANTALLGARFDEDGGFWHVRTGAGDFTAKSLVASLGPLSRPSIPKIDGMADFAGPLFHSATWDHGVDLSGKRVAVIGTDASAVQFIPEIVSTVAQLDVYQRTAPWVLPRPDRAFGAREQWLLAKVPGLQWLYRAVVYAQHEARAIPFVYAPWLLGAAEAMARRFLRRQVADPVLRAKLTPNYSLGCKRVLVVSTYYPALARKNVTLLTDGIRAIGRHGIVSAGGEERPVDVIILGTGFDVEHMIGAVEVRGVGGQRLGGADGDALEAYKGCTVAGFPNFFMITGPNTGLGHNSMIYMIESGAAYVLDAIKALRGRALHSVDVKPAVQEAYNRKLQRRLKGTVWSSGCRSWYLDRNGKNVTLWPGFTFVYRWITRRFDIASYTVRDS